MGSERLSDFEAGDFDVKTSFSKFLGNVETQNLLKKLAEDTVKNNDSNHQYETRKYYLQHKRYTTLEEDRELQLLNDPATGVYAARITYLEFNENRTDYENRELELLSDPEARSTAYRLLALEYNQNRTKEETIEMRCLRNPILRPRTDQIMSYVNRSDLSKKELHDVGILLNPSVFHQANEILALEKIKDLTYEQKISLSKDYLMGISKVEVDTKHDYKKEDFSGAGYNTRDMDIDKEVASFRAIENAFNEAAKKLTENYFRQAISINQDRPLKDNFTLFKNNQSLLNSPMIQGLISERQVTVALALEKVYFESKTNFSQTSLDFITDHFNDLIVNKSMKLNTSNYHELYDLFIKNLRILEVNLRQEEAARSYRGAACR